MEMINYKDLGAKIQKETCTFTFNNIEINIVNFLSVDNKYDLIMTTLQQSLEDDMCFNEIKMDMFFHLYLMIFYTNIVFSKTDKEDLVKLYDEISSSGLLDAFLDAFDAEEYNSLLNILKSVAKTKSAVYQSAGYVVSNFIKNIPAYATQAKETLEGIDKEKVQELMALVKDVQGGKPVVDNK